MLFPSLSRRLLLSFALVFALGLTACEGEVNEQEVPLDQETTAPAEDMAVDPDEDWDASDATLVAFADLVGVERANLVGREVSMDQLRVGAVVGDSTFWVMPADGAADTKAFVVLTNLGEYKAGPGTGADGRYNVDEGDVITLMGTVQRVEESHPQAWSVRDADAEALLDGEVYIRADKVRKQ